jgi:hypothetical protein
MATENRKQAEKYRIKCKIRQEREEAEEDAAEEQAATKVNKVQAGGSQANQTIESNAKSTLTKDNIKKRSQSV